MKKLSNPELASFCEQMALVLRSGISSIEGLHIMRDDATSEAGKKIVERLIDAMEQGASFSEAVEQEGSFPVYLCNMLRLGERAGRLDDIVDTLAGYYHREDEIAKGIKSAVTYPLVMLGMMVAVMLVLIVKVLPIFNQVLSQLGAELTGIPGAMLHAGEVLSQYSVIILSVAVVLAAALAVLFLSPGGKSLLKRFSTRFFATRKLSEMIAVGRFASGMYVALASGLDIDDGLDTVSRILENPQVEKKVDSIRRRVQEGENLGQAVMEEGLFSGVYARMLSIGIKTGATDEVLRKISRQYDQEIEERIAGAISRLEPTMVALLSLAVGMILLSVMLPLMGILSNIG